MGPNRMDKKREPSDRDTIVETTSMSEETPGRVSLHEECQ